MFDLHPRPCFYDPQYVCLDCSGERAECIRLIAADQADDDD